MSIFDKFFRKGSKSAVPALPAWETVVEMMYDRYLDSYADEVVQVIYSKDKSKRYVLLKDDRGFFTYQLEELYRYEPEEWQYLGSNPDALPAMWEPAHGMTGKSIFQNTEELLAEITTQPEYQQYFYHKGDDPYENSP